MRSRYSDISAHDFLHAQPCMTYMTILLLHITTQIILDYRLGKVRFLTKDNLMVNESIAHSILMLI